MAVLVEEAGPAVHFEGYVGDLDLGEQHLDHGPQADQRRRLLHGVEGADHDPVGAVAVLDAEIRIGVKPVRRSAPGLVENLAQLGHDLGRVGVEGQGLTRLVALGVPGRLREQLGPGIAPADASRCVQVPPAQPDSEAVEHAAG